MKKMLHFKMTAFLTLYERTQVLFYDSIQNIRIVDIHGVLHFKMKNLLVEHVYSNLKQIL